MEEEAEELGNESLQEKFDKFIDEAEKEIISLKTELNEITEIYNDFIKKPNPAIPSKAERLNVAYEKVTEYHNEIGNIEIKVKGFENKVFGKDIEDEDALSFKLNELKSDLQELHTNWGEKYETLSVKIEGLLPGATSAGLAKSYHDQKNSYRNPNIFWSIIFITSIIGMVLYAIFTIKDSDSIGNTFMNILARSPFFIPAIWLALFSSKQQSQNRRLEQEYAHKESLAKSYDGYKREIEILPESDNKNEIMEKLVASLIEAASYNPSSTLEKMSHNDSPPIFSSLLKKKSDK